MTTVFSCDQPHEALSLLNEHLATLIRRKKGEPFFLALSGGETARQLFSLWAEQDSDKINWDNVRFYWVDERCVPPEDSESNFGHAYDLFFGVLHIPPDHIRRIRGEANPQDEARRYSEETDKEVPHRHGLPRFDAIILGAGGDGHTASIFADSMPLLTSKELFAVSRHPISKQQRITMTGPLILNASALLLPIIGKGKTEIVRTLLSSGTARESLPAGYILAHARRISLYTDCVVP